MVAQASAAVRSDRADWVLLSYRIPREPSTPRIAVWRKLKELGVVQLGDGLVALPAMPETREQFDWIAARVREAEGEAMVWIAHPSTKREHADLVERLRTARTEEYEALSADVASTVVPVGSQAVARWRRQWRKINKRDHFRAEGGDASKRAINDALAQSATADVDTSDVDASDVDANGVAR